VNGRVRTRSSPLFGFTAGALVGMIVDDLGLSSMISYWGDTGPFVVGCALAGALLWTTSLRRFVGAAVVVLGILWLVVAFTPFSAWLADGLVRRDPPEAADAVFVNASSIHPTGELSYASMSRLLHGIELVAERQAPVLVLSDLKSPYPSYAGAAKALMENLGIVRDLKTIAGSGNTREEAVSLARLCREQGWKRVIVVTSPYHSTRSCAAVEHEGLSVVCSPSVETAFDLKGLGRSDERRRAFSAAIHERIGLWLYGLRGWLSEGREEAETSAAPAEEPATSAPASTP
jgi:uncharacterized SAM-binding protein YcdF (DUF218 family)